MQNYVKTIEYMVKQNTNAKIPKECRDIIFLVIFQFVNHLFTLARHYSHLQNPERPRRPHARGADLQRVVDPEAVCVGRLGDLGLLDGLTNPSVWGTLRRYVGSSPAKGPMRKGGCGPAQAALSQLEVLESARSRRKRVL